MVLKSTRLTLYAALFDYFMKHGYTLTTAESLTAGLAIADFVSLPGTSKVVKEAFVTYSDEAKNELLGVDAALLKQKGAVCEEVALQMAKGACKAAKAHVSIALTGVAGPGPQQTPDGQILKAGTVWVAVCVNQEAYSQKLQLWGSRDKIRKEAAWEAWRFLAKMLEI